MPRAAGSQPCASSACAMCPLLPHTHPPPSLCVCAKTLASRGTHNAVMTNVITFGAAQGPRSRQRAPTRTGMHALHLWHLQCPVSRAQRSLGAEPRRVLEQNPGNELFAKKQARKENPVRQGALMLHVHHVMLTLTDSVSLTHPTHTPRATGFNASRADEPLTEMKHLACHTS